MRNEFQIQVQESAESLQKLIQNIDSNNIELKEEVKKGT